MGSATKQFTITVKEREDEHDASNRKEADGESKLQDETPRPAPLPK